MEVEKEEKSFEQTFFDTNLDNFERKRDLKARSKLPWADQSDKHSQS